LVAVNCGGCMVVSIYDFLCHGPGWEDSRNGSFPGRLIAERAPFGCAKEHADSRCILIRSGALSSTQPCLGLVSKAGPDLARPRDICGGPGLLNPLVSLPIRLA
jgi:hypothetical protein